MVHLPFFLQNAGLRKVKVAQQLASKQETTLILIRKKMNVKTCKADELFVCILLWFTSNTCIFCRISFSSCFFNLLSFKSLQWVGSVQKMTHSWHEGEGREADQLLPAPPARRQSADSDDAAPISRSISKGRGGAIDQVHSWVIVWSAWITCF